MYSVKIEYVTDRYKFYVTLLTYVYYLIIKKPFQVSSPYFIIVDDDELEFEMFMILLCLFNTS